MQAYYEDADATLYLGDCREILPMLVDEIDVVVTDPPYGQTSLAWDRWPLGWLGVLPATNLWCFGTLRSFMRYAAEFSGAGWKLAQDLVWEKHTGSSFHADRFRHVHEQPAQFYRGRWDSIYRQVVTTPDATARVVRRKTRPPHMGHIEAAAYTSIDGGPRLMRSVIRVHSMHGMAQHPTEKPEGILRPLLEYSTPPGGVVLDPFVGSGATLLTAVQLGYQAVGIETDEKYCEIAARRLEQWAAHQAPCQERA